MKSWGDISRFRLRQAHPSSLETPLVPKIVGMLFNSNKLGLYIHIPFCRFMCHYCDFAKTANWGPDLVQAYMKVLHQHLEAWLKEFVFEKRFEVDTLFLGGGTPGLLTQEYETLFQILNRHKIQIKEASLEVNPENISKENLLIWKSLGFNRISIGIQSFHRKGLKTLTRQHEVQALDKALSQACEVFDNVSADLIYGWQGQSLEDWIDDLNKVLSYPIKHLSLYCLTLEERTPFGRAYQRGSLDAQEEEFQERCYEEAKCLLAKRGWFHYECSNWALSTEYICFHNEKYWKNEPYIGVGAGACAYLPVDKLGLRYQYTRKERVFTKNGGIQTPILGESSDLIEFESRTDEQWLMEYVGCGLRYVEGIDLNLIHSVTGKVFNPRDLCVAALSDGRLKLDKGRLFLSPDEWFRETRWCLEVIESLS